MTTQRHLILIAAFVTGCTGPVGTTPANHITINSDATYTLATGDNDMAPDTTVGLLAITPVTGSRLSGFDASAASYGDAFWVRNQSTTLPLVIAVGVLAVTDIDRLHTFDGADFALAPGRTVMIEYYADATTGQDHGWQVVQGPGSYGPTSVTTPSRALGTAFQPSTVRPTEVTYSARIVTVLTGVGRVELVSDSSNPPTTVRARVAGGGATNTAEAELHYQVRAGDYVLLRSVTESGSPTYTLTTQTEQSL